jgi:hypothetical protein
MLLNINLLIFLLLLLGLFFEWTQGALNWS